ncbi:hypothetical protein E2562_038381 [Oryza meyeriana var. granulata]|uniref:Uncharacterized protein n=1 Tax=Oryza meyeriana var. granulata TaxID=110450 RepID=A0A6G1CXM4_9ORYZ|nr:hypothetical protein E2562_038381 [Oryza meyeriana var. granulata]
MPPSRRRSNSSLLESSTIITANLIMASSSYLLSKITPRAAPSSMQSAPAPARPPQPVATALAWAPRAAPARSVEPTVKRRTVLVAPDEGEDGKVDERAGTFIRKFKERTQSDIARMEEEAAAAVAAAWPPPPLAAAGAGNLTGTVYGYHR